MNTACSSRAIHLLTNRSRTLLAVGLLALVLAFGAFSLAPSAHAASVQGQKTVTLCSFTLIAESTSPDRSLTVKVWRDSCGGTDHGELLAHVAGTFKLRIYGNPFCGGTPQQTVGPAFRNPGGFLNTREFNDGNNVCVRGDHL